MCDFRAMCCVQVLVLGERLLQNSQLQLGENRTRLATPSSIVIGKGGPYAKVHRQGVHHARTKFCWEKRRV